MNWKDKAIKGVRWTTVSAGTLAAGGLIQTWLLTHLLKPSDFGAMEVVSIALGLSIQLVDMGFSNAIIREQDTTQEQLSSLYWLNVAMSWLMGALVWFLAPAIARFFHINDLDNMLRWIVPAFLLSGLAMQYQAILQKSLLFKRLAIIEVISFVIGFATAIVMAFRDFGAYALVGGALAKTVVSTLSIIWIGRSLHRPKLYFSKAAVAPFMNFGMYQMMEKLIGYIAINLDSILIGRWMGAETLGVYGVMRRLLIQPWYVINPIVTKVTYPVMAKVQKEQARFKNIALRSVHLVAAINIPIYLACAIGAALIIPVFFDARWATGALPFQWLALCFLLRALVNPLGSAALAKGKANVSFYLNIIAFVGIGLAVAIGSQQGLQGILIAMLVFNLLLLLPFYYLILKPLVEASWLDFFKQFHIESFFAILGFGTALAVCSAFQLSGILALVLYGLIGGMVYLYGLFRFRPHLMQEIRQMMTR
ncbi:MAG: MOP flippase family protein [Lewinellaceae bacterium]|nr:MOP flippase family protein [Lewinellaceae bacterium]